MKNAHFDYELLMMLMGYKIDRPKYGYGGDIKMWQAALQRIAFPFDPVIVGLSPSGRSAAGNNNGVGKIAGRLVISFEASLSACKCTSALLHAA